MVPITVEIVTVVALVAVVGWRTKRWRLIWVPVSVVVAVLGALGRGCTWTPKGWRRTRRR